MTTSPEINELAAALAKAQGEMGGALKDSANPFFKSKYADLSSVWEACRAPLAKYGLSIVQIPSFQRGDVPLFTVTVETRLLHTSGQFIEGAMSAAPKDDSPQAIGSVVTYLRRYALQSMVGVAPEDDDGEAAQGRAVVKQAQKLAAPKGFDDWLTDLTAVADEGTAKLQKTWTASKVEYRQFLTTHYAANWDALKGIAAKANHREEQPA